MSHPTFHINNVSIFTDNNKMKRSSNYSDDEDDQDSAKMREEKNDNE